MCMLYIAGGGGAGMQSGAGAGAGGGYQGGYLSFQQQQQYSGSGWGPPSCSLAKLQQMAEAPQHPHQVKINFCPTTTSKSCFA